MATKVIFLIKVGRGGMIEIHNIYIFLDIGIDRYVVVFWISGLSLYYHCFFPEFFSRLFFVV